MKILHLTKKPDSYDFREYIYVWDNFLSDEFSDYLDEEIYMHTNWRYCNRVDTPECAHTIWGRTYKDYRPEYINDLTSVLESKTGITIPSPEYIGLNGQTKGMDACLHRDCSLLEANKTASFLYYIGAGDADGDLIIYNDSREPIERIQFIKNRMVLFDGSIPHSANGPTNMTLRMSFVYRGYYEDNNVDANSR
tara:strand:- start:764 stop:1345 length:582 start_codon:yes stop_codon:yes gene_type:complete